MSGVLGIILAGSPKPVQATGGQVVYDLRGYRYHAFTNAGIPAPGQTTAIGTAGSFTVDSNLSNKLFDVCRWIIYLINKIIYLFIWFDNCRLIIYLIIY
jgi:hypothetical protein